MKLRLLLAAFLLIFIVSVSAQEDTPLYLNPDAPIEERVEDLLSRMSLEEKVGQMTLIEKNSIRPDALTQYYVGAVLSGGGGYPSGNNSVEGWFEMVSAYQDAALATPLGIPMLYGVDAVHGHSNLAGAVIFPHNIGLGAAANPELIEQIGQITALEMIATGIYWNYSPVLAVPQDIRWGRTYEGYSENTALVTELSTSMLIGLQGNDLASPVTVLGTPKHFVGDGGTAFGTSPQDGALLDRGLTDVDEATLREIHLAPYYAAIENGARSIMISYSSWGDERMHGQSYLINDVLIDEMGFEGFIVSDWGGIDNVASNYYDSVVQSVNAGIDMNMVPYDYITFINTVILAVEQGDISMERIDEAVANILRVKFELGLFEHPYGDAELMELVGSDEHRAVAREAVSQSLVLLKNENDALPLDASAEQTIFVAGKAADNIGLQSGGWTIEWQGLSSTVTKGTTIVDALEDGFGENTTVRYSRSGRFNDADGNPVQGDIGIVVIGEEPYAEWFGDNDTLALSDDDRELVREMRGKVDTLIVVLFSGRPIVIDTELNYADAFVAAWLPGTEGNGVTDVLFGDHDFVGKLPYTWLRNAEQLPFDFDNLPMEGCNAPLFPFGYGLSYESNEASVPWLQLSQDCAPYNVEANSQAFVLAEGASTTLTDFESGDLSETPTDDSLWIVDWGDSPGNVELSISSTEREGEDTSALTVSYDIASWGGFSHNLIDAENGVGQDWTIYNSLQFWLYGNATGGIVQVEIFDNRNPDIDGDTAERWYYRITDDYEGWQLFTIPFDNFQRRTDWQPAGAPNDGLGLNDVTAYAMGFPVGVGANQAFVDNVRLVKLGEDPLVIDDFEIEELTIAQDSFGNNIGYVPWGDTAGNVELRLVDATRAGADTRALVVDFDIEAWGGFTHVFNDGENWTSQDWTAYNAMSFWFLGNNTGAEVQFEIFDNRNPELDGDSAERWFYRFVDDSYSWKLVEIPFVAFQRRSDWQPEGALDDGFNLNEVSGYAFGLPAGVGSRVFIIDDVRLFVMPGTGTPLGVSVSNN